ncbi:hypothetical protein BpHYR1_038428 [Brachionus plicatilis]|uniref:Uncharacterized protein n=1 Tax=Brachionus plicatilis TaxID=10195 RepID=A0A3M7Q0Y3_BRAPC|nr:hypothetical protein BpHYR1_038428 [Brachionus plicatilis]
MQSLWLFEPLELRSVVTLFGRFRPVRFVTQFFLMTRFYRVQWMILAVIMNRLIAPIPLFAWRFCRLQRFFVSQGALVWVNQQFDLLKPDFLNLVVERNRWLIITVYPRFCDTSVSKEKRVTKSKSHKFKYK